MASSDTTLTIQQASAATGLTVHTLRYYERIGLLTPVQRASNGHRRYSQQDLDRIALLNRMRLTGMPLSAIRRFAALLAQGDPSLAERIDILLAHREAVVAQIDELNAMLAVIDYKVEHYQRRLKA